jgi:hypothetical protein
MRSLWWSKPVWLATLLLVGLAVMDPVAAGPRSEFACQVIAQEGRIGLVVVLADTKEMAAQAAVGAQAYTIDNARGTATEVVQCIRPGEERFTDYQFEQFYQSVPR